MLQRHLWMAPKQLNTLAMKYVTKLQTNCQLTFALIETLQHRHYVSFKFILLSARKETHISTLSTLIPQAVVASSRIPWEQKYFYKLHFMDYLHNTVYTTKKGWDGPLYGWIKRIYLNRVGVT